MKKKIKKLQLDILNVFSLHNNSFALAGGTALDLYYLHHRFSRDLDFFSHEYNENEISNLVTKFEKVTNNELKLENEFTTNNRAKVKFYITEIEKDLTFKIDFIEDVFFRDPTINIFNKVAVYDIEHIYYQKIMAIAGTRLKIDNIGREKITRRNEGKDIIDIYYLSKNYIPIHQFLKKMPREQQRGIIYWYRSYSRQELKINILDFDIYDKKFDSSIMIKYLDDEIKKFMESVIS